MAVDAEVFQIAERRIGLVHHPLLHPDVDCNTIWLPMTPRAWLTPAPLPSHASHARPRTTATGTARYCLLQGRESMHRQSRRFCQWPLWRWMATAARHRPTATFPCSRMQTAAILLLTPTILRVFRLSSVSRRGSISARA